MVQTVITDLPLDETIALLKEKYCDLTIDGTFFAICSTEYDSDGDVSCDFLQIIEEAINAGYSYVNTIVYPTTKINYNSFCDNVRYVVWLCKNHSQMKFNKDSIREKHIWKDVEWGKRKKNYNPKGKDPGNVWIPTIDDGKANITEHILLDDTMVINRLLTMVDCGDNHEIYQEDRSPSVKNSNSFKLNRRASVEGTEKGTVYFKSSEDMCEVVDASVKLVVTSPPYWNLKDYFKKGQIGQEPYSVYLKRMETVWRQCFEKLSDKGSLWININIRVQKGQLIPIPRDFVKMCKEIGYHYKGIVIWHKSSGIPTNDKNIVDRHEYMLVFSKDRDYIIDADTQKSFADYKNSEMNGCAFWNINRKAGSVGKKFIHPAIYPNDLVSRIILLASNEQDVVLDPFLGSGTSLISALQNKRNFIGYEFNDGFKELMVSRFEKELPRNSNIILR